MTKQELSQTIWDFAKEHSGDELAGILARSLIGIGHAAGVKHFEFKDDVGTVVITCNPVPPSRQN